MSKNLRSLLVGGLLPVALPSSAVDGLAGHEVTIDLPAQEVRCGRQHWSFVIEAEAKQMLIGGQDAIELTLTSLPQIDSWTTIDRPARPWVYL